MSTNGCCNEKKSYSMGIDKQNSEDAHVRKSLFFGHLETKLPRYPCEKLPADLKER